MNERILELADEARIKFSSHWAHEGVDTAVITRRDLKEFAELIVRECLSIVEPTEDSGDEWCVTLKGAAQEIREHFGVEE